MLFSCVILYLLIVLFLFKFYQFYFIFCLLFLMCLNIVGCVFLEPFSTMNTLFIYADRIGVILVLLSYLIFLMVYLFYYRTKNLIIFFILSFMLVSLGMCFFSCNLLCLYVFFEFCLLPLFLIIVLRGSRVERFDACVYMLIYTFVSSFLFLLFMCFINNYLVFYIEVIILNFKVEWGLAWILIFFIFFVKLPVYSLHRWLRKAHVEAPVGGSMILAGVLLKLGGFGLYRILFYINNRDLYCFINFFILFSLIGAVFSCTICIRQVDIKLLIAYSSVRHIGLLLAGILSNRKIGFSGAVAIMVAHGFCSRALFYVANVYYIRVGTRRILMIKGLVQYFPVLCVFWLGFCLCNMGTPPSFNFVSEIILLLVIFKKRLFLMFICLFYLFLVVYYNLVLFLRIGHGHFIRNNFIKIETVNEIIVVFFHIVLMFTFLFKSDLYFL